VRELQKERTLPLSVGRVGMASHSKTVEPMTAAWSGVANDPGAAAHAIEAISISLRVIIGPSK
jgi:hypothetical protein